jgi:Fe-S-cluster containining protein
MHKIRSFADGKPHIKKISPPLVAKLTNHFNEKNEKLSKFARLKIIYELADAVMHENDDIQVCRAGCAYCCSIPVEISPLEAKYIAANTDYKITKKKLSEPVRVLQDYCPLLDKKTANCSVYDYRPFNCRAFAAYDSPDYCRDGKEHFTTGGPLNGFGNEALKLLAFEIVKIECGMEICPEMRPIVEKRIQDIREFFKRKKHNE